MSKYTKTARPEHEVYYNDVLQLIAKHADKITSREMLAVAANLLGKLIAMQDPGTITREVAMEIVVLNIENGNEQVVKQLSKTLLGTKH